MTDPIPAPVMLGRDAYLKMIGCAEKAKDDPSALPMLIEAIGQLEVERMSRELTMEEQTFLARTEIGVWGLVGNQDGYYRCYGHGQQDLPHRFLDSEEKIAIVEESALPAAIIDELVSKGELRSVPVKASTFMQLYRRQPFESGASEDWYFIPGTGKQPDGAWIYTQSGKELGWMSRRNSAAWLVDCHNAIRRLWKDVHPQGSKGGPESFFADIRQSGLIGLMGRIHGSISPEEHYHPAPPADLLKKADYIKKELAILLADIEVAFAGLLPTAYNAAKTAMEAVREPAPVEYAIEADHSNIIGQYKDDLLPVWVVKVKRLLRKIVNGVLNRE